MGSIASSIMEKDKIRSRAILRVKDLKREKVVASMTNFFFFFFKIFCFFVLI